MSWSAERRLALYAWGWITVGGAMSAIFAWGMASTFFMSASMLVGAIVGGVAGLPGGMALTSWIRTYARHGVDPRDFTMTLELIGVVGALLGCFIFAWWYLPFIAGVSPLLTLEGAANGIYAIVGVVLSGRWVGCRLAASYLRTWGLPVPPSWFRRLASHLTHE